MKVSKEIWEERMINLMKRRQLGTIGESSIADKVRDYKSHLSKVFIGGSVLDVGCGNQIVKRYLPEGTIYFGIDAFPISYDVEKVLIEEMEHENLFDTVIAFAVLDGCLDFDLAIDNMKRIARKNIVILTGLGIEPDKFHTHKLSLKDFQDRFEDWELGYFEMLSSQVCLIEFKNI